MSVMQEMSEEDQALMRLYRKRAGRRLIGVEVTEAWCELSAKRLAQGVLVA